MAENTKIEWAHHTFNPWVGCTKVSPACDHCYAEGWAKRSGMVQWGPNAERRRTSESNWRQPIKWNAEAERLGVRYRVFCSSLADVFDNAVPDEWRIDLMRLISSTQNLDWLLLTKRIGNAEKMLSDAVASFGFTWGTHWKNVWIGSTVCNQVEADRDIPKLLAVPAAKRFLSMEPLLGTVDLNRILVDPARHLHVSALHEQHDDCYYQSDAQIDWVIVGGESGPGARPMHPNWVRSLRDQCAAAGVPFLFKQWGEWLPDQLRAGGDLGGDMRRGIVQHVCFDRENDGRFRQGDVHMRRVGKKTAGRVFDGRLWDEVPV